MKRSRFLGALATMLLAPMALLSKEKKKKLFFPCAESFRLSGDPILDSMVEYDAYFRFIQGLKHCVVIKDENGVRTIRIILVQQDGQLGKVIDFEKLFGK